MKILFTALALAAAAAFIAPAANALTLQEAMAELAGMHCSGSTCTASETIETEIDLPDIITVSSVKSQNGASAQGPSGFTKGCAANRAVMFPQDDGISRVCTNVTGSGVAQSISSSDGHGALYRKVVTTADGGTEIVYSCDTTTKELTWNGPFTDRANAWSVSSSMSSSGGAC